MNRPAREAYVRGVVTCGAIEVCAGIEYRAGDRFVHLRNTVRTLVGFALLGILGSDRHTLDEDTISLSVEAAFRHRWPDRAYFVEVGNDDEGWIQIYQPFGVPRNDNVAR